jgi:hypothetical protein
MSDKRRKVRQKREAADVISCDLKLVTLIGENL